ncbi:MAG TPA: hypothetical protein VD864_17895 [Nocardioides sp.]|nr:hypothetical protein [Nocardioides sp.]
MTDEHGLGDHLGPALDRILGDLTAVPLPRVEPSHWQDWTGAESAVLWGSDGSSTGVWLDSTLAPAEQVVMLAEQVQEWVFEALCTARRPTNWPRCPAHPDNHPMAPRLTDGAPTWCCPISGHAVAEIGRLGSR